jgi:hypothetical protein
VAGRKARAPQRGDASEARDEVVLGREQHPCRLSSHPNQDDPRRLKPISVKDVHNKCTHLTVAGELWAEIEWSEKRGAWCVQDGEGRCLSHHSHIHGKVASKAAISMAQDMIRDGRMPTPEAAKQNRDERLERQHNTPSAKRRREQREQQRKEQRLLWHAEWETRQRDECTFCGAHSAIVEPGTDVHAAHLRCTQCGRGGRFLRRDQVQQLAAGAS